MRYRTEIHVAADRYVCLQLPSYMPEGRAMVVVTVEGPDAPEAVPAGDDDPDRVDVEWWDDLDEEVGRGR